MRRRPDRTEPNRAGPDYEGRGVRGEGDGWGGVEVMATGEKRWKNRDFIGGEKRCVDGTHSMKLSGDAPGGAADVHPGLQQPSEAAEAAGAAPAVRLCSDLSVPSSPGGR